MPEGQGFIKHEFDEAIAIQQCIVEATQTLSQSHPLPEAKTALQTLLKQDQKHLKELQRFGKQYDATGEVEEVAGGMIELMQTTLGKADEEPSDAYEAHAVLLSLKRKQQDSTAALLKISRAVKNTELRDAASVMGKDAKAGAQQMADLLATFAVQIATRKAPSQ